MPLFQSIFGKPTSTWKPSSGLLNTPATNSLRPVTPAPVKQVTVPTATQYGPSKQYATSSSTGFRNDIQQNMNSLSSIQPVLAQPQQNTQATPTQGSQNIAQAPQTNQYLQQAQVTDQQAMLKAQQAKDLYINGDVVGAQKAYSDMQAIRQQVFDLNQKGLELAKPTQQEQDLQTQLINIRDQGRQFDLSTQEGVQAQYGRGRPLDISTGRAGELQRQAQFTKQDLANQESKLIDQLSLAQNNRQLSIQVNKMGLDAAMQDQNIASQIYQMQQAHEDKVIARTQTWDNNKKNAVASVLEHFKGIDPSQITPAMEAQISSSLVPYGASYSEARPLLEAQWMGDELDRRSKQLAIQKTQADINNPNNGGSGGFTPSQINQTVNAIAQSFDNEPVVKNFNTINEAVNFTQSLGNKPTDDIARVYQFAKVMDPNSAVREGEYKTVQAYSTAVLQHYGLNIRRVFTNAGFLTDQARGFINQTLQDRLNSSRKNYDNVYSEYLRRVTDAKAGKMNSITNYANAYPQSSFVVTTPNGKNYSFPDQKSADAFKKKAGIK